MKVSKSPRKRAMPVRRVRLDVAIEAIREHVSPKLMQARATAMSAILALEKRGGVDGQLALSLRFGVLQPLDHIDLDALPRVAAQQGANHG